MFLRILIAILMLIFAHSVGSRAQEFPVVFQSNITSGKTPTGTKVQAKLSMATLFDRTVVPQNAKFSGQVVVSQAKTKYQPALLSVRIDSVTWKNMSIPVKLFLTEWFYASIPGNPGQISRAGAVLWNDTVSPPPAPPKTATSPNREKIKDVTIERASDGSVTLLCKQHTIKIDRSAMYVLTTGDLATTVK